MEIGFAELLVLAIILSRLAVPLLIIRFPLPAIVACLVIDAVDQTVFQALAPQADLAGYQSYDKALDIYYLVIAYISTLRNWTSRFAVAIARFLIIYRLVGVVLFELSGERWFLFLFPNTFEYFFIFYEAVRLFWDPRRMSDRLLVGATAFIWIVIKLPQEWWIHIAQLDVTDIVQERIFGVPAGSSWVDTFAARPWIVVLALAAAGAALYAAWWLFRHRLPPPDRPITVDADDEPDRLVPAVRLEAESRRMRERVVRPALVEKLTLLALVSIIFGQLLQLRTDPAETVLIVGIVIVINAVVSTVMARQGVERGSAARQFLVTGAINVAILVILGLWFAISWSSLDLYKVGFLLLLVTLLITLYDRYRPEYAARFAEAGG